MFGSPTVAGNLAPYHRVVRSSFQPCYPDHVFQPSKHDIGELLPNIGTHDPMKGIGSIWTNAKVRRRGTVDPNVSGSIFIGYGALIGGGMIIL